ncbi:hypothetical protein IVA94_14635 [Bradyrhizobium sp. 156]|uniref:hypothetical protein n=1 Tax=Bradyrhizobium sp. 156 TaxID=2782630 RepID=UPI001FF861BE|nr:hypothetical protein [Bradyrhizobium sp. 156]MCK1322105.1 hypothetical protein [Bradyrhizobium sp. 156]
MFDLNYQQAIDKSEHLIAIGQTTIYLRDGTYPWAVASDVEVGSSYRFNGPSSVYIISKLQGLTFKWSVDFEKREANGAGYSLFDRERLRDVMMKLPEPARRRFAKVLRDAVMPDLEKRTAELREAMNKQIDSEDCVRGLIAFAEGREQAAA